MSVCVCERHTERECVYVCKYTKRFIMGTDSHSLGGQEDPQPAVCQLENQESQWNNSTEPKSLRTERWRWG